MQRATTLILAAAVLALPTDTSTKASCNTFGTQMTVMSGLLTLSAVANGTNPGLVVLGQASTLPGSTVVLKGESPKASLSFDIDGDLYGWVVGDIVRDPLTQSFQAFD
jgi:heat shock protein HslJ